MLIKNLNHTISFSLFSEFPELLCVMSDRALGDLNVGRLPIENAQTLLNLYQIPLTQFVGMRQIHGVTVQLIDQSNQGTLLPNTDGLVTVTTQLFLGVKAADCVPLFFYDPFKKGIAVAHAGWRGTLNNICQNVIRKLQDTGSDPENIFVGIGPHIGGCCYDVTAERAKLFLENFRDPKIAFQNEGKWFLDIGQANKTQLLESGVKPEHIDASLTCTSCQNNLFFSYRKDNKETFGEMLGIIGIRNLEL